MKKVTKKRAAKASHKKSVRDLDVKPVKGGTVRGGLPWLKPIDGPSAPSGGGGGGGRPKV